MFENLLVWLSSIGGAVRGNYFFKAVAFFAVDIHRVVAGRPYFVLIIVLGLSVHETVFAMKQKVEIDLCARSYIKSAAGLNISERSYTNRIMAWIEPGRHEMAFFVGNILL